MTKLTFAEMFASAPMGAIIAFSDGTPRPPERFKRKLSDWETRNSCGRLVERKASEGVREYDRDRVSLNTKNFEGAGGVRLITMNQSFSASGPECMRFEIQRVEPAGRLAVIRHSEFTGDSWVGAFDTLAEAIAAHSRNPHSTIHRVGDAGALGEALEVEAA